ncbi:phytanoyl-CoA dioxygenase family protein [Candidatus Pelagibacter sp.]|nr:phytanoyl-CoA dioxygenase family protein [Candidatus Pelagibacter sp.]
MTKNFSETGFIIVRNAISKKLIKDIQNEIFNVLRINDSKEIGRYKKFCSLVKNLKIKEYDFTKPIFESLHFKGLLEKMFLEKKFYKAVVDLMGKDLAFCTDTGITLNLPNKPNPKKNYLFKDWHQEIWSGANPSTIQIWTPLIHKDSKNGQMELIKESHKWGHVPHINRQPTLLPKKFNTKKLNLEYGDVIIFSTLLIHRSLPTIYPRLSLPILLKNFKIKDSSYQDNRSFKIYSYSEITKIERILGNHFLTPYRLKNLDED